MSEDGKLYQAAYDFQAEDDTELSMKKGDVIRVTETTDPNWWAGMYLLTFFKQFYFSNSLHNCI